jgi:hypothetical protein
VGADDRDGAVSVVQDRLADRAEQQPGQATAAPGADHDELGLAGRTDQRLAGVAWPDLQVHLHLGVALPPTGDRLGEYPGPRADPVVDVVNGGLPVAQAVRPGSGPDVGISGQMNACTTRSGTWR